MDFRILGPLEVWDRGRPLELRRLKHRALLAALLLRAGSMVSADQLLDDLWGERPPPTAKGSLQNMVSALRKLLGETVVCTRSPGYLLDVEREEVDLFRFERLLEEARSEADAEERVERLREALALWRGSPLADLAFEPFVLLEAPRLEELRVAAREELIEARLALGEYAQLLPELEALVAEHPFNERLRGQLMIALYGAGRQIEALELYRDARQFLVEELGLEPGTPLRELEQAILRHDPELTPVPSRGSSLVPMRKTATVLYVDFVPFGMLSGQLDPEALGELLERYSTASQRVLERHGGTVEILRSGGALAVFGVPQVHEDDTLRALRAAIELRQDLRTLGGGLESRVGISTGEIFVGSSAPAAFFSGEVVRVAKGLEEAAALGEILLGAPTVRLVRDAVKVSPTAPLRLMGKQPLGVWRLLELIEGAPAIPRRFEAPLVGRRSELGELRSAFEATHADSDCRLLVLVGEPGIGKTRLAREFVNEASRDATVLIGRCASYGQGATWLPLREILGAAGVHTSEELISLLSAERDGERIALRIAGSIGLAEEAAPVEEANWAFRRLFEALAERSTLILVFEDVHWAEPTLLDLIEHLAEQASGPVFVLCLARAELLESRPEWAQRAITLPALPEADVGALVDTFQANLDREARARVVEVAEGNPLFAEQLVAHAQEEGLETLDVPPPSIEALLASRLDLLAREELLFLQRASLIGRWFSRDAVLELSPTDFAAVDLCLRSLIEKGLIRPGPDADSFAFHHVLLRNVAYAGVPKRVRADLHEHLAAWLEEERGATPAQQDEIVGYHLEQAARYKQELGQPDRELAAAGRRSLAAAGRRAYAGQDFAAAAKLLERAAALVPEAEVDIKLELNLVQALRVDSKNPKARLRAVSVAERAAAAGDRVGESCARIAEAAVAGDFARLPALINQALPLFEAEGDDFALMIAYSASGDVARLRGQMDALLEALERAATHGRRAEVPHQGLVSGGSLARLWGTTPVSELLAWEKEQDAAVRHHPRVRAQRAVALAMLGRYAEARSLLVRLRAELAERGAEMMLAIMDVEEGMQVELLAGDPAAAVAAGEKGCRLLEGVRWHAAVLSTWAGLLAEAYYLLDQIDEAEVWAGRAAELGAYDDALTQVLWRQVRAKVLARRGNHREGERLAREAVEISEKTDLLNHQASAYADLADVLLLVGPTNDGVNALEEALARYERKENLVMAERVRARLAKVELSDTATERA
jgi:DNA-binding SARP family transcriptional activator